MHIKKGDLVKIISGSSKNKGKVGKVVDFAKKDRVRIEGIASVKKHMKSQRSPKHPDGGIIELPSSVHISNVMLMSEDLKRPVRTGYVTTSEGEKKRVIRGRGLKADYI